MLDMSVHDIDVARWFLGAGGAKRVLCGRDDRHPQGSPNVATSTIGVAICEFGDGQIACFYASSTMTHATKPCPRSWHRQDASWSGRTGIRPR